jgi:hypothetical protein
MGFYPTQFAEKELGKILINDREPSLPPIRRIVTLFK